MAQRTQKIQGYEPTVKMNFYGQDKGMRPKVGQNPNQEVEDEYILNLQQQVHFMELELKILKEKVIDDEKKSGIGSLFDDDKTSHQHMHLLKQKYSQMKKDYDKEIESLQREQLKVAGEQFVLNSQLKTIQDQKTKTTTEIKELQADQQSRLKELDRLSRDAQKQRMELEQEIRSLEGLFSKQKEDNFNNTMFLMKDEKSEDELRRRHTQDTEIDSALIAKKEAEVQALVNDLQLLKQEYLNMADLQDAVRQEAEFREKVEKGKVEEQQLQIQVSIMNDGNDQLYRKKDDLIEQKELLEQKRDQMRKDAAAAEDQANRRMAKKLTSNTNQDYKQKVIALESLENEIQETEKRMMESKAKHDSMLAGRQLIQEQFKRKTEQMEEDKEIIKLQDDKIAELKALIEAQELKASENGLALEKAHRLSNYEEQRSRELIQRESALSAKLEYIEKGYDYKSKVKSVNTEVFRQLMAMNANVNNTVQDFIQRVDQTKNDTVRFDAQRQSMQNF